LLTCPGIASGVQDFSFTGTFSGDDDVQFFFFTADGVSNVTLRSYSYAGGIQADGNVVSAGGFDPILSLFDSTGLLIGENDDGLGVPEDPNTIAAWDTEFSQVLVAGIYIAAIAQFDNFANGPSLSDGFLRTGDPFYTGVLGGCSNGQFCDVSGVPPFDNRTNEWAFDILNVEAAVPEPSTALLVAIGLLGIAVRRHRISRRS